MLTLAMRVHVLYFGVLKDVVGREREDREVSAECTVSALLATLEDGAASRVWKTLAAAVNREYAPPSRVLCEGDEVALLPPVSGGCHAG